MTNSTNHYSGIIKMKNTKLGHFKIEELGALPSLIVIPLFAEERAEAFYESLQDAEETKALHAKKLRTHHHKQVYGNIEQQ